MFARALFLCLFAAQVAPARAQDCEADHARLDRGEWRAVSLEQRVRDMVETPTTCLLALWARLAERARDDARAGLYLAVIDRLDAAVVRTEPPAPDAAWRAAMQRRLAQRSPPTELVDAVAAMLEPSRADPEIRPAAPTPEALCTLLSVEDEIRLGFGARCRVARRIRSGSLRAALLDMSSGVSHRTDTLWVAVQSTDGWRVVGELSSVGAGRGEYGRHRLLDFRARAVAGGAELVGRVRAETGETPGHLEAETRVTTCGTGPDGAFTCRRTPTRGH